jgi:hypothetical protein
VLALFGSLGIYLDSRLRMLPIFIISSHFVRLALLFGFEFSHAIIRAALLRAHKANAQPNAFPINDPVETLGEPDFSHSLEWHSGFGRP